MPETPKEPLDAVNGSVCGKRHNVHLANITRGSTQICAPLDFLRTWFRREGDPQAVRSKGVQQGRIVNAEAWGRVGCPVLERRVSWLSSNGSVVGLKPQSITRGERRRHWRQAMFVRSAAASSKTKWLPGMDSNHRPDGKQPFTLPLSYPGTRCHPAKRGPNVRQGRAQTKRTSARVNSSAPVCRD